MPRRKKQATSSIEETLHPMDFLRPNTENMNREAYNLEYISATQLKEELHQRVKYVKTGTDIDKLLSLVGGFKTGQVYFIYGLPGTGKTQICKTLAATVEGDVIWIDGGENTFSPTRLTQIAETRGIDGNKVLEKIHYIKALNATHFEYIISGLAEIFMTWQTNEETNKKERIFKEKELTTNRIDLIILDSLAPMYRIQYQGMDAMAPRAQAILRSLACLKVVCYWFNCVGVVTDQVIANMNRFGVGPETVPVGGPTVGHNLDVQIKLRKLRQDMRAAALVDSSENPIGEVTFRIAEAGVVPEDVEEAEAESSLTEKTVEAGGA